MKKPAQPLQSSRTTKKQLADLVKRKKKYNTYLPTRLKSVHISLTSPYSVTFISEIAKNIPLNHITNMPVKNVEDDDLRHEWLNSRGNGLLDQIVEPNQDKNPRDIGKLILVDQSQYNNTPNIQIIDSIKRDDNNLPTAFLPENPSLTREGLEQLIREYKNNSGVIFFKETDDCPSIHPIVTNYTVKHNEKTNP